MIDRPDEKAKERVNQAIANIRLMSKKVSKTQRDLATEKAEIVVIVLNEFRQYINANPPEAKRITTPGPFKHDEDTVHRVVYATMQTDDLFRMLPSRKRKEMDPVYQQVWKLLENIHSYLVKQVQKASNNATL